MTFQAAIQAELIAAIVNKCGCDATKAAAELAIARKVAKQLGLPLADTLHTLGLV
jgi:hypothetical protein